MDFALQLSTDKIADKRRIYLLDEFRGAAVICMVVYHALYTIGFMFNYEWGKSLYHFFMPAEPFFAALFIFISGICTHLSHSNLRRGLILFTIAAAINAVTAVFVPNFSIKFGVLNLLSVCMILFGLFHSLTEKIHPKLGLALCATLFVLTWGVCSGYIGILKMRLFELPKTLYSTPFLFPVGLKNERFVSTDYFPILPWAFVFFSGAFFADIFSQKVLPETFYKIHLKSLVWAGRRALYIYIIHQPVIILSVTVVRSMTQFKF